MRRSFGCLKLASKLEVGGKLQCNARYYYSTTICEARPLSQVRTLGGTFALSGVAPTMYGRQYAEDSTCTTLQIQSERRQSNMRAQGRYSTAAAAGYARRQHCQSLPR